MDKEIQRNRKTKKLIIGVLLLLLLLLTLKIINLYKKDIVDIANFEGSYIAFNGLETMDIELNSVYADPGAIAYENGYEVTGLLVVDTTDINYEQVGTYKVIYYFINSSGDRIEKVVYVNIVDTKSPEIVLNGSSELIIFNGDKYKELGAKAIDNYDGDISENIIIDGYVNTNVNGAYKITYKIYDSSNNYAKITRTVIVESKNQSENIEVNPKVDSKDKQEENYVSINLEGQETVYLEWPAKYVEDGVSVQSSDGDISNKVIIEGSVNTNKLGSYELIYKISNSKGLTAQTKRTIIVRDTIRPEITLNGLNYIEIAFDENYTDEGAKALDNHDGDISGNILVETNYMPNKIGQFYYKYTITDSSGNKSEILRIIKAVDRSIPIITIEAGKDLVSIPIGSTNDVIMDGVSATDNHDGDITGKITWASNPSLNLNKAGEYTITYMVKDSSNNEAISISKTINVVDTVPPIGQISYSTTNPTNSSIIVTLTTDEEIITPDGWVKTSATTYTKSYIANINKILTIKDLSGNSSDVNILINNIDTIPPSGTVSYDPSILTNGDVVATLTTTEEIATPNGWDKVNSLEYTKLFKSNVAENLIIIDNVGNSSNVSINVSNIDKILPVITIIGDNPIVIEQGEVYTDLGAMASDNYDGDLTSKIIEGGSVNTNIIGPHYITYTVTDSAGNIATKTRTVVVNDTTPPVGSISINPSSLTKNNVLVTLTTNEEIKTPTGWVKVDDNKFTKTYTDNITGEVLEIKDKNNNIGTVIINVNNIDRVAPEISIIGANPYYLPINEAYFDEGATAIDDIDGIITNIEKETNLIVTREDVYTIKYTVVDTAGNIATATREVHVIDYSPNSNVIYSPVMNVPTNTSVIATLKVDKEVTTPEGWTNGGDNKTFTKEYTENVVDEAVNFETIAAGYPGSNTINISNIDKIAPIGTFTYEPVQATSGNVITTLHTSEKIITPEGFTKVNDTTYNKVYTKNIETDIEITDIAGNKGLASIYINWIDDKVPTAEVTYNTISATNENVIATLVTSKEILTPEGFTKINDTTYTKEYTFNTPTIEIIELTDALGNKGTASVYITWIDKEAPNITILGDNPLYINQHDPYIESGVQITDDKDGDLSSEVIIEPNVNTSTLGSYKVTYKITDSAGNLATKERTVIVEDTITPTAILKYSKLNATKENITVTLTASEGINSISGWTKVDNTTYTKEYTHNVSNETVVFSDLAGNSGSVSVNITWIDKELPTGSVVLKPSSLTNGNVLATLNVSEEIILPEGWTKVDGLTFTKIFTENSLENIVLTDLVGNEGAVNVTVSNIDKILPTANITYNPTQVTNDKVTVTLFASEAIKEIEGWKKVNSTTYEKTYDNNVKQSVQIIDLAGNSNTYTININWINTDKPTGVLEYSKVEKTNENVTVTLTTNKEINTPTDWTRISDTVFTKEYIENTNETITIEDLYSNTSDITINITNIDRIAPTGSVSYSTIQPTNGKVVVTLVVDEQIDSLNGWTKIDNLTYMYVYEENNIKDLTIKDLAGNTNVVHIGVNNIDKVVPTGVVEYSKLTSTNENVIITLTTSKEIITPEGFTKVSDTVFTKEYITNGSETITIKDLAGNTNTVNISVTNIDKTLPTGIVTYSPNSAVKEDVVVTLTTNKLITTPDNWTKINNTEYTKIYSANTTEVLTIEDLAGNTCLVNIVISWIDKEVPTGVVTYSPNLATNTDVLATLVTSEAIELPINWTRVNSTTYTKVYSSNEQEKLEFKDLVGNVGSATINIYWIDKTDPTAEISYSTKGLTNQDVEVTLELSEAITGILGWTEVNSTTYTKVYSENTTEVVKFTDEAGNQGSKEVNITNIDKTAPTADATYSIESLTNKDVQVTIVSSEDIQELLDWTKINSTTYIKIYKQNDIEDITIFDIAGNSNSIRVNITWIDKELPTANVLYSTSNHTNNDVTVTIKTSEEVEDITGWTKEDEMEYTKVYKANAEETVVLKDKAGNTNSVNVSVSNIDKIIPTAEVEYSISTPTNKNVVVTLTLSEEVKEISGWTKEENNIYTKVYGENKLETVNFEDLAGNIGTVNVSINWINKIAPVITIKGDNPCTVIINTSYVDQGATATDSDGSELEVLKSGEVNTSLAGEYAIIYTAIDSAGNNSAETRIVNVIEYTPIGTVKYNPEISKMTNGNVTVTLSIDKEVNNIDGWVNSGDNKTFTKEYTSNVENETVSFTTILGNNPGSVDINITNIDRIAPTSEVTYEPKTATKNNVIATIIPSKEIQTPAGWEKQGNGTYTKKYETNVDTSITLIDLVGNTGTAEILIDWIDKANPTGEVTYNINSGTNQSVVATLVLSEEIKGIEGWTEINTTTYEKTYEENYSGTVEFEDLVGNIGTVNVNIPWIDKLVPTAGVSYSPNSLTKSNVTVTLTISEEIATLTGWTKGENNIYTKVYSTNITDEVVEFEDLVGNTGSITINIDWIDKVPPTAIITYNPSSSTNQDVTATLTTSEVIKDIDGWTNSGDGRTFTKSYSSNVSNQTVVIEDLAGNTRDVTINIDWMDKAIPTATIEYTPSTGTKGDVIAKITPSKEIQDIAGWDKQEDGTYTREYTTNVSDEEVVLVDLVGNQGSIIVNIDWIDKIAPTAEVTYTPEKATKDNVMVSINPSEQIQDIIGWDKQEDGTYEKIYSSNVSDSIVIKDLAGNSGDVQININWIDKIAPTATVMYSPNTITNQDVEVTLTISEEIKLLNGWEKGANNTYTKTYEENAEETVTFEDLVGNQGSKNIAINWIDKKDPTAEIKYSTTDATNQDVTVTLTASEAIETPTDWIKGANNTYTKVYKANVSNEVVTLTDLAGNNGETQININWIDKVEPTGTITYVPNTLTNSNVMAKLETNKEILTPAGWEQGENNTFTKIYQENVSNEEVILKDEAGNMTTIYVNITWIDKELPTAEVKYSTKALTNEPVEVILEPSEAIETPTGWVEQENGTYTKLYVANVNDDEITFTDLAGNTGTVRITITWIDTEIPTGTIKYAPSNATKENVIATLTTSKDIIIPDGWTRGENDQIFTKVFEQNTVEDVELKDEANNIGSANVNITWIDKTAPTANISYSNTAVTNEDVIVTITTSEPIENPTGWTIVTQEDYTVFKKIYDSNETEDVVLIDLVGNENTVRIEVSNIYKNTPIIESIINSSWNSEKEEFEWTNKDVTITAIASVEGGTIEKYLWNKDDGEWQDSWTGVMSDEGNYKVGIIAVDIAGNQSSPSYTTVKIDKTAPIITITGGESATVLKGETYIDQGATAYDANTPDIQVVPSGTVDTSVEADYRVYYTATDIAGNTTTVFRRVYVTSTNEMRYYDEMKAIEELVLQIQADVEQGSGSYIGTELTSSSPANIRGINYWKEWYLITKADLLAAGYQHSDSVAENYLDMTHANYIVRYTYTPGAVQSINGEYINGSYVHTFNYFGDPETTSIYVDGLLSAITNDSTKTATQWGELAVNGGTATYDDDGGILLGEQYPTLAVDQTKPINERLTVCFTVKGPIPQENCSDGFPRTIVAISEGSGKYLSWIGIRNNYLHVYSYTAKSAKASIDREMVETGFISIDLRTIVKEYDGDTPIYYDFNNEYLNIQVTSQRAGETKVYINGSLARTFSSDTASLSYNQLTIGDLRPTRNLKYQGYIYNFAFYSEVLDQAAIDQNWKYFKQELGITQ